MTHNPFERYGEFLTTADHHYSLDSEWWAKGFVGALFREIAKRYGEEKARNMFAPYGRALNNKDRTRWKNAELILELYYMKKPSISGLARELAGNDEDSEDRVEAWRQQIHRALNNKRGDITPVGGTVRLPSVMAVTPSFPAKAVPEFTAQSFIVLVETTARSV